VSEALLSAVRADAPADTEFSPAEGAPGDVAKVLLSAARSGLRAVHLVGGDPLAHDSVVKEVQAVARTNVPFEVVPGVGTAAGVATYAGVPLPGVRTVADVDDVQTLDFEPVATALARGSSAALSVDAGDLATVRDGLLAAGVDPATPVAVTGEGTGDTQYTTSSTVDSVVTAVIGFAGRVVLTLGAGVTHRDKLGWWENRPLYGWKVLVPRTKEQAGAMSERLRAYGAIPCEVPTIAVEPPRTPAQMERAIKGLVDGRYAWVVFTSTNAVRAVWEKFAEHGLDARHFGGVKIACIGEATADAVRAFGVQPELVPAEEQSSEGLLAEFSPHDEILDPVGRILLPRADIATETLAAGLTERGWEVDDVTAYRTVRAAPPPAEIRDAIKSGGFDAVLFTSSSTVRNLVGIAGKPHARTVVAVIGPKTAETASEFGLRVDVQPPHASVPDLVEALAAYAVELREKLAAMPAKQRRGSKVQGPTALRYR
jgi:uroporphyrinogen III methyltransferase/synthase